eukprot:TRINITY_DN3264_c0_g2_i3.p1 TRINITY_DN3264_c0_g2~~TRINITY_DN3264_c0_g2_i3.p1  ORF type:complete len:239 (+),score=39.47 TRINITY_DN3264_c0_g2_i3:196-912(+)
MPAKGSKKVGGKWVKPAVQRVAKPAPKSRKRKAARDLVPLTAYNGWQRLVMTRGVAKDLNPMGSVMQAIRNQVRAHLRKRRRVGDVGEMLQRLFDASLIHRLRPGHLANFSIEEDDIPDGATYVASDSDSDSEEEEEEEEEKEEEADQPQEPVCCVLVDHLAGASGPARAGLLDALAASGVQRHAVEGAEDKGRHGGDEVQGPQTRKPRFGGFARPARPYQAPPRRPPCHALLVRGGV